MGLIRITYETVTPESAEDGEAADRGWINEEGEERNVEEAIRLLEGCEPSSSQFHPGVWYTQADGDTCLTTGAETRHSYHLVDFSEEEQRQIYEAVYGS